MTTMNPDQIESQNETHKNHEDDSGSRIPISDQCNLSDPDSVTIRDINQRNASLVLEMRYEIIKMCKFSKRDPGFGDDLFQTLYLKILKLKNSHLMTHQEILKIARNMEIDRLRRRDRYSDIVVRLIRKSCLWKYDDESKEEIVSLVREAINTLSTKQRDVIYSRYINEESVSEGSRTLGITEDAYRSRIKTAIKRLRNVKSLKEIGGNK